MQQRKHFEEEKNGILFYGNIFFLLKIGCFRPVFRLQSLSCLRSFEKIFRAALFATSKVGWGAIGGPPSQN
jgi:hypothetical protein